MSVLYRGHLNCVSEPRMVFLRGECGPRHGNAADGGAPCVLLNEEGTPRFRPAELLGFVFCL